MAGRGRDGRLAAALRRLWVGAAALAALAVAMTLSSPASRGRRALADGRALAAEGRNEEALLRFLEAGSLRPLDAESRGLAGAMLARLGRDAEAEAQLRAALALAPDFAGARVNLGKVLMRAGRREDAAQEFFTVLQFHHRHPAAVQGLAEAAPLRARRG